MFSIENKKIWVAGHKGMVGSAVVRRLEQEECHVLAADRVELDLTDQKSVLNWMETYKPEVVVLAAAKVGGIFANSTYPADFLYENLMIECNVIHASYLCGVEKLLFLGSSCIYPKNSAQPMSEDALLSGPFEPTNEWYAMAKTAGIKLCQAYRKQHGCDFISAMPTNLFGIGDNFHPENSHVPAALLSRFHEAKQKNLDEVVIWGTGNPMREFLYVEDLADACVFLLKNFSADQHINVGTGKEITIRDFALKIKEIVQFDGQLVFDQSKPDGMFRKVMNVEKMAQLGWRAQTSLENALSAYYRWYCDNLSSLRT